VNYKYPTSIIDMNAATGEIYIEDADETILGSAGCALDLKFNNEFIDDPDICVILVEDNEECIEHLMNVLKRRYPDINIMQDVDLIEDLTKNCVLVRKSVDDAIDTINNLDLRGRSIYFFDPLLSVNMAPLRKVYENRVGSPFEIGVEFIIFSFTSDWIFGRNELYPLPRDSYVKNWTIEEKRTVNLLDSAFGDTQWHETILSQKNPKIRMERLISEYQMRLFHLFRFVIPMPFTPKENQLYHLIFCSNYQPGARIFSNFYEKLTNNKWNPNNRATYNQFCRIHRNDIMFPGGNKRPYEWKILWHVIKNYNHGKFDEDCRDILELEKSRVDPQESFEWLKKHGYITIYSVENYEEEEIERYELNWATIEKKLKLNRPAPFKPLIDKDFEDKN